MHEIIPIEVYKIKDEITIDIAINDACNYNCSYCYNLKDHTQRTNAKLDENKIIEFIYWIYSKKQKHISLELLGGEPTLHLGLLKIINEFKNKNFIDIIIYSNFSKNLNYYILNTYSNITWFITLHYRHIINNIQDLINNIKLLSQLSIFIKFQFTIMIEYDYELECYRLYDKLQKICNNLTISLIDDFDKTNFISHRKLMYKYINLYNKICLNNNLEKNIKVKYSNNIILKYNDYDAKNNKKLLFKNWLCSAGNDNFSINYNGNIYQCSCIYDKLLGNINNYQMLSFKNHLCNSTACCSIGNVNIKNVFKK